MFAKIRAFIEKHILAEVPSELSACLDCGVEQCSNKDWETCPYRLARLTALTTPDKAAPACGPMPPGTEAGPGRAAPAAVESEDQA